MATTAKVFDFEVRDKTKPRKMPRSKTGRLASMTPDDFREANETTKQARGLNGLSLKDILREE